MFRTINHTSWHPHANGQAFASPLDEAGKGCQVGQAAASGAGEAGGTAVAVPDNWTAAPSSEQQGHTEWHMNKERRKKVAHEGASRGQGLLLPSLSKGVPPAGWH